MLDSIKPEDRPFFKECLERLVVGDNLLGFLFAAQKGEEGLMDIFREADGLTADEVIRRGSSKILASKESRLTEVQQRVAELEGKIEPDETRQQFELTATANFRKEDRTIDSRLTLQANFTNRSDITVEDMIVDAQVFTPGREIPWRTTTDFESFSGGVAPGESREFLLVSWYVNDLDPDLEYIAKVRVDGISGPNDEPDFKFVLHDWDQQEHDRLSKEIADLETEIDLVQSQVAEWLKEDNPS